jgi:hypothetical protein
MSHWGISTGSVNIFYPGASIGVVEINPDSIDADSALRIADRAMYQDKNEKTNSRFYASINSLQGVFLLENYLIFFYLIIICIAGKGCQLRSTFVRKSTIIMLIVAVVAVAGTQLGWW